MPLSTSSCLLLSSFFSLQDLPNLGKSPWETALGTLTEDSMSVLDAFNREYGDMPPWGRGPEQGRLTREGNRYIKKDYPKIDFIQKCRVAVPNHEHVNLDEL